MISRVLLTHVAKATLGSQERCALFPPTCPFLLVQLLLGLAVPARWVGGEEVRSSVRLQPAVPLALPGDEE